MDVFASDGHGLWVNSVALELAGINRENPDPAPGLSYYARDAFGDPTGFALEVAVLLPAVHAIGDGTVGIALDAIEAATAANPPRDRRRGKEFVGGCTNARDGR